MKKIFTLFFSLLFAVIFTPAFAQQNVYVWGSDGNISVFSSSEVDSISFSANPDLFNITTSAAGSVTDNTFKVWVEYTLNDGKKLKSGSPEIGVCYSDENQQPTYQDSRATGSKKNDSISVQGLDPGTNYYYRAYVKLYNDIFYGEVNSVTTQGTAPKYVIINGHKFIDLGLESGLLWAKNNIGASTPYEDGDYFAWGETEPKTFYRWDNYKWTADCKKYNDEDGKTILDSEDDVATVKWGKKCRIPSQQDFKDLDAQCTWVWKKKYNGTCGYLVTGPNGSTLFFPASGYIIEDKLDGQEHGHYWSSNRKKKNIQDAYRLYFYIGDVHEATGTKNRYWGMPIRPVAENK